MSQPAPTSLLPQRTATVPFQTYKRSQAALARHRLYPLTVYYAWYAIIVLTIALSTTHTWTALAFFSAGCAVWTLVEYLFQRCVLHGRFPPDKGVVRRFLHERLDPLHWDHHIRPFDGRHISDELKDILPLFFVAAPVSFLFPVYTVPVMLVGVVQSYVWRRVAALCAAFFEFKVPPLSPDEEISPVPPQPPGDPQGLWHYHSFLDGVVRYPIPGNGTPIPKQELK